MGKSSGQHCYLCPPTSQADVADEDEDLAGDDDDLLEELEE